MNEIYIIILAVIGAARIAEILIKHLDKITDWSMNHEQR